MNLEPHVLWACKIDWTHITSYNLCFIVIVLSFSDMPPPYTNAAAYPNFTPNKPPHALRAEDRKMSAPVFGTKEYQSARDRQNENRLSRCDEVTDIPAVVEDEPEMSDFVAHVNR